LLLKKRDFSEGFQKVEETAFWQNGYRDYGRRRKKSMRVKTSY